jgi:3-hydroxyisobutyrate dehydrogenase-like beta-hydroxyacid dehydrogenase
LIVGLKVEALAEGLVLAQKDSLDLNIIMEVIKVAHFRPPLLVGNGENILKRDFSTYFASQLNKTKQRRHACTVSQLRSDIKSWRTRQG